MPINNSRPRTVAVIPCRYDSTRFPGKPLALLGGMPLMWHVYQQCLKCTRIDEPVIATDDDRIARECTRLGIPHLMTGEHPTGTDRVAECADAIDADIFVNVQGDEPFVSPTAIESVVTALQDHPRGTPIAANAYARIDSPGTVIDHNVVKVALRFDGTAVSFSRQPIPYPKGGHPGYLRQLGLYAFTRDTVRTFGLLDPGPLEEAEGIEMLRLVEHSIPVLMVEVEEDGLAVDTPEDLARAARHLTGNTG